MLQLDKLVPLTRKRKRIGRGGSRGGTAGKGHKGQNARSGGGTRPGFEGGQMPLHRRLPKRGFNNTRFGEDVVIVGLQRINDAFEDGDEVTPEQLAAKGLIKSAKSRPARIVKVLAGPITKKVTLSVHQCSASAAKAVEEAGGKVVLLKEI